MSAGGERQLDNQNSEVVIDLNSNASAEDIVKALEINRIIADMHQGRISSREAMDIAYCIEHPKKPSQSEPVVNPLIKLLVRAGNEG